MVLSIEAKQIAPGKWEAYTDNGRERTGRDVIEWVQRGVELGAGEILLTSVDREGTRKGFDLDLIKTVSAAVSVPVIASGGMGSADDMVAAATVGGADGIAMADMLHYGRTTLAAIAPGRPGCKSGSSKNLKMSKKITLIDYGMCNLLNVARALEHCGAEVTITEDPAAVLNAEKLVVPGVGAFSACMHELEDRGFADAIRRYVDTQRPMLGICVGMQMLFEASEEFGEHAGLGILPGRVRAVPSKTLAGEPQRVPHIGWNHLVAPESGRAMGRHLAGGFCRPAAGGVFRSFVCRRSLRTTATGWPTRSTAATGSALQCRKTI